MNAAELIDALNRAGAKVEIVDGAPRVRGAKVSADLMEKLRANRDAVLAEAVRRIAQDRDRYAEVPAPGTQLVATEGVALALTDEQKKLVCDHVMRQPRPVHAWVMARATMYFEAKGCKADDCEWRACLDVVCWQRRTDPKTAVQFLEDLNT